MLNAHGCLGDASPSVVFVTELRTHIRRAAAFVAFATVFFSKKSQRNAGLCKLAVDVRIVQFNVSADFLVLIWEKKPLQLSVGKVLVEGPMDISFACCL